MAERIITYGPKESFPDDDDSGEAFYAYIAEAMGTDDQWHRIIVYGPATPFTQIHERSREQAARALEEKMKEKGVWE